MTRSILPSIIGFLLSASSAVADDAIPLITIDQFGYLPDATKIAVLRDPVTGFDAEMDYVPSNTVSVINALSGERVYSGKPALWRSGNVEPTSGDRVWHLDFSSITAPGTYRIVDTNQNIQSPTFDIGADVYRNILKHAFRVFYYQRSGFAKQPPYADPRWTDSASHVDKGQEREARLYSAPDNPATIRDVHGGWYDAGDFNKYTSWTARFISEMLISYEENPQAWGDDFNIPESGNGIPDLIDEMLYGLAWLKRMQNEDGSVLSIVDADDRISPPSASKGRSLYGPANTSATLATASVFALASKITTDLGLTHLSADFRERAIKAFNWAEANPNVIFRNNDEAAGSKGIGAGQQEVNDERRRFMRLVAHIHMFELTGDEKLLPVISDLAPETLFMKRGVVNPYRIEEVDALMRYAGLEGADKKLAQAIISTFTTASKKSLALSTTQGGADPYRALIPSYTWGSNRTKAAAGNLVMRYAFHLDGKGGQSELTDTAAGYTHYLHGTNPLGKVYLSNMNDYGAENSVAEFYHGWFKHGSELWDSTETSKYGPAPGFVVGGPNPRYSVAKCCLTHCGGGGQARCSILKNMRPSNQPAQKSYADFNDSWPVNSWEVTENSNSYQTAYLRLLANFVR